MNSEDSRIDSAQIAVSEDLLASRNTVMAAIRANGHRYFNLRPRPLHSRIAVKKTAAVTRDHAGTEQLNVRTSVPQVRNPQGRNEDIKGPARKPVPEKTRRKARSQKHIKDEQDECGRAFDECRRQKTRVGNKTPWAAGNCLFTKKIWRISGSLFEN